MRVVPVPKHALVRVPGESYSQCISCHPMRHTIDLKRARRQHEAYRNTLRELGLEVIQLPRDDQHPDACFVEDTAVVHDGRALICRPAKTSRRGEVGTVEDFLRRHLSVRRATAPATVEGGDVIHLPDKLVAGLSERTNLAGIRQMKKYLGVEVLTVKEPKMLHLKSHMTYLGNGFLITTRRFAELEVTHGFDVLVVPDNEEYAANTLAVGETVIMSKGRPRTMALVKEAGFDVIALDTSGFEKCDGALTCLSLMF